MLKILVLSFECWRDDTNGGNILSSIFSGQDFEFAQVYCMPGEPRNTLCKRYFQITMKSALHNIIHKTPAGKLLQYDTFPSGDVTLTDGYSESNAFSRSLSVWIYRSSMLCAMC